ncbi:hypothetical protein DOY81_007116 [Sarcophaga bullata]|nr:hypothetical protein DOY81_007116 [Sarcophaga bullata]
MSKGVLISNNHNNVTSERIFPTTTSIAKTKKFCNHKFSNLNSVWFAIGKLHSSTTKKKKKEITKPEQKINDFG